ncbi:MAG: hypothetical protein ACN0LA_10420 [Candidatus Longimicrobiales bacterium M2_2A_002]
MSASASRRLAIELLRSERASPDDGAAAAAAALLEHLHRVLQPLIGSAGYEMLLARAAIRGAGRHGRLKRLEIPRRGPPPPESVRAVLDGAETSEGAAETLVEEMLTFLADLIGWRLLLRILEAEWPDVVEGHDPAAVERSTNPTMKES